MATRKTLPAKKIAKKAVTATARKSAAVAATSRTDLQKTRVVEPAPVVAVPVKQKLVRDSFTMPKAEYEQLGILKARLLKLSHAIKKGELLRAGVGALVAMSDSEIITAVGRIHRLKTGRPKNPKPVEKKLQKKKA